MSTINTHEVRGELAYDLVQDHLDAVLAVLDRPLPRAQLIERLGSTATYERMLRLGLLREQQGAVTGVASAYHQVRQEGMLSFLERHVLPSLNRSLDGTGTLHTLYLRLTAADIATLRRGPVQRLLEELVRISELPARGPTSRFGVLLVGTSRVHTEAAEPADRALLHLKLAAQQRAAPGERDRAFLTQADGNYDHWRHQSAQAALARFIAAFGAQRVDGAQDANYHLTLATHWRAGASEPTPEQLQ